MYVLIVIIKRLLKGWKYNMSKIQDFLYKTLDYDRNGERQIKKLLTLDQSDSKIKHLRARFLRKKIVERYSCYIAKGLRVGNNLRIEHAQGIRLGETAIIGDNVRVYQFVNIMAKVTGDVERKAMHLRRHAVIGNNVVLCAGCYIIGPVTIGEDCIIGARAVVTHDVPAHSVVIGVNRVRPKRADECAPPYKMI